MRSVRDVPGRRVSNAHWSFSSAHIRTASRAARTSLHRSNLLVPSASVGDRSPAVVIGAGISGLATAVALQKINYPVVVLERETALREEGAAIAFWTNAFKALQALDAADELRTKYPLLETIQLCSQEGEQLNAFTLADCEGGPHELRGLRRVALLKQLASILSQGTVLYNSPVTAITTDSQTGQPVVQLANGEAVHSSFVVGADGVRSVAAVQLGLPLPNYSGYVAYRGVAELTGGAAPVPMGICRQMYGQGVRAGMYPVSDTEVYWYVCFNAPAGATAPPSKDAQKEDALKRVAGWGGGIHDCIGATAADTIARTRIGDRWLPASGRGLITLAGDALHPMTPNLGQGGGTAIEDAVVLAKCIKSAGGQAADSKQIETALREYESERRKRTLPLTVRAGLMGTALQIDLDIVCNTRNFVMSRLFNPAHFLEHASYDCGAL